MNKSGNFGKELGMDKLDFVRILEATGVIKAIDTNRAAFLIVFFNFYKTLNRHDVYLFEEEVQALMQEFE